jgi:Protein of unknown function (DUF4197)
MQRTLLLAVTVLLFMLSPCQGGFFDALSREVMPSLQPQIALDNSTVVKGLKEALATGTQHAVTQVAGTDGYFGNGLIKILLPDTIQQAADILREIGYQKEVDDLVLSMNRAAEHAAPGAARFFGDAIRQMTLEDAKGILGGGERSATAFFEKSCRSRLFDAFRPSVSRSMEQVGTARAYKELVGKYEALPLASLVGIPSLNLDEYITNKALDGLFKIVGNEEVKIRSDPAAQTTALLRKVFGGK